MLNLYVVGCGGIGGYLVDMLPSCLASLSLELLSDVGSIQEYLEKAGSVAIPCVADSLTLVDGDVFNPRNALRQGMGAGGKLVQRMRGVKGYLDTLQRAVDELEAVKNESTEQDKYDIDCALDKLKSLSTLTDKLTTVQEAIKDLDLISTGWPALADRLEEMKKEMLKVSFLQRLRLIGYNSYVTPNNVGEIIPLKPEVNTENLFGYFPKKVTDSTTVIFMCVDNKKTRYELSKWAEQFDNVLVINGGNDLTTGQINVYERAGGVALDPNLYELYPDINEDADKRPDEEACTIVAPKHDQIAVTNSIIANCMMAILIKWAKHGLNWTRMSRGRQISGRDNEVLLDIERFSMQSLHHPVSNQQTP